MEVLRFKTWDKPGRLIEIFLGKCRLGRLIEQDGIRCKKSTNINYIDERR